jgi:hypothetical protein
VQNAPPWVYLRAMSADHRPTGPDLAEDTSAPLRDIDTPPTDAPLREKIAVLMPTSSPFALTSAPPWSVQTERGRSGFRSRP